MRRLGLVLLLAGPACQTGDDDRTATSMATAATTTATTATTATEDTGEPASSSDVSSGDAAGTEAPSPDGACEDVAECRLHGDCCTCAAIAVGQTPEPCDLTCERDVCTEWGTTELLCSHTCLLRLVECDADLIDCADAPPTCEAGFVPSVEQRCWTRRCVPAELCTPS